MSASILSAFLTAFVNAAEHPDFTKVVGFAKDVNNDLKAVAPAEPIVGTLVTGLAPQAAPLVAEILGDTNLLTQLAGGISDLLKSPSTAAGAGSTATQ